MFLLPFLINYSSVLCLSPKLWLILTTLRENELASKNCFEMDLSLLTRVCHYMTNCKQSEVEVPNSSVAALEEVVERSQTCLCNSIPWLQAGIHTEKSAFICIVPQVDRTVVLVLKKLVENLSTFPSHIIKDCQNFFAKEFAYDCLLVFDGESLSSLLVNQYICSRILKRVFLILLPGFYREKWIYVHKESTKEVSGGHDLCAFGNYPFN